MRVAGKLTITDWKSLEGKLNIEENENWGNAFLFFEERIRTRYLEPIQAILGMEKYEGEGFAIVNLQCSLIETIESFINGWIYSNETRDGFIRNKWHHNKKIVRINAEKHLTNKDIFISFFSNRKPFKSKGVDGEDFFKNVRCALLHETQTKNNWRIKKCSSETRSFVTTSKIIYRDQLQRDIKKVIDNYKNALILGEEFDSISAGDLRANYIAKFNHLCEQYTI